MPFDVTQPAYIQLRSIISERTSPLIAWVGSGLSVPGGIPAWAGLRKKLEDALRKKIESFEASDHASASSRLSGIESEKSPWLAFQRLKSELGPSSFRDTVREVMRPAETCPVPESYVSIWRLPVKGVLNLNLDRLATRAFSEVRSGNPLEFTGAQGVKNANLFKESRPFILNLHGNIEDSSTWVLTRAELESLRAEAGYPDFIRTCLLSHTVVFFGISVDDLAVGSHLESLIALGIHGGSHYWITDRSDEKTDRWAESVGIRVIRYDPVNQHEQLGHLLKDLRFFVAPEDPPLETPLFLASTAKEESAFHLATSSRTELLTLDANQLRQRLNVWVEQIVKSGRINDYESFLSAYDEFIYRAWYVSDKVGFNQLFSYTIESRVAKGAFGVVYKARTSAGEVVAIKVLLEEIRINRELLQSFRRGVRSMKILTESTIPGVVTYKDSSEIPAIVVMDWVEGQSLKNVVEAKRILDWVTILTVGVQLSGVLRQAHELPQRVLHRDLRPSNIMLRHFNGSAHSVDLVVLDFDLSWHKGATELSVVHGSTMAGYLAPEQLVKKQGVSTRTAAVDSFGLGMVFYFLVAARDPMPAQHQHTEWQSTVAAACARPPETDWRSLPNRFARIILRSTSDQQADRWDISQIQSELSGLLGILQRKDLKVSSEMLCEEIAARTDILKNYDWNGDNSAASVSLPTGLGVKVSTDSPRRLIKLDLKWTATGSQGHKNVGKFLTPAAGSCEAILKSGGWNARADLGQYMLTINASIAFPDSDEALSELAATIDKAIAPLRKIG